MNDLFGSFGLSSEVSLRWGMTLLHFMWQGTIIGLLALLAAKFVRQASGRYWVNAIALMACPCAIIATFAFLELPQQTSNVGEQSPLTGFNQSVEPSQIVFNVEPALGYSQESLSPRPATNSIPLPKDSPSTVSSISVSPKLQTEPHSWLPVTAQWLTALYLVGSIFFLLRFGLALWGGNRLRETACPVTDSAMVQLVNQQALRIGLKLVPVVAFCERVAVPVVIGVLRPTILLPASLTTGLTTDEFAAILSHEMAHIRRFDLWLNLFQRLMESLLFFHPAVWILSRRLSAEREICCDDLVVRSGHAALNYAGALLRMAEICTVRSPLNNATLAVTGTRKSLLEHRIGRLLDLHHTPQLQFTPRGIAGTVLVSMILVTVIPFMEILNMSGVPVIEPQQTSPISKVAPLQASEETSHSNPKDMTPVSQVDKTQQERLELISVSGMVYGPEGEILTGVQVFAVSCTGGFRKLSNTVSDKNGRYEFKDLKLPIIKSNRQGIAVHGEFEVFAISDQLGFTWRGTRGFYPDSQPFRRSPVSGNTLFIEPNEKTPIPDSPNEFFSGEKAQLDLVFNEPKQMRLRVINDEGVPLANTKVRLWNADPIPGSFRELVSSQPMGIGFTTLYVERVMPENLVRRTTDSQGWFEFAAMPSGCEFRIQVKPPGCAQRMVMATTGTRNESQNDNLYSDGDDLVFSRTQPISVFVTFADSKQPAPRVWVLGGDQNGTGSDHASTDEAGKVTLDLPHGECKFQVLPEYQTPYAFVDNDSLQTVIKTDSENEYRIELQRAAEVEIRVVDAVTGKAVAGADVWTADQSFSRKSIHNWRSFQQPGIVRQGAVKSDDAGIIRTYFRPGKYSLGLCSNYTPEGYSPTAIKDAVECEFSLKEKSIVTLKLSPVQ